MTTIRQDPPPAGSHAPAIARIDHLHLRVADRPAAVAWYARALGLQPVAALAHWAVDDGPLVLADAAGQLHLALFERPPLPGAQTIALGVGAADFGHWQQHLGALLGQVPAVVDHGLSQSLYFDDPDGNPWEITCTDVAPRP